MRRKRKQRNRALTLPGARIEEVGKVVGYAKVSAREHAITIDDDSVDEFVIESISALGLSLSDREVESVTNRLIGRKRVAEEYPAGFAWHLL
jgi:hypothetical protein